MRGRARRRRASRGGGVAHRPGAAPELEDHHPAGDGGAEGGGDEADEGREAEGDGGVDHHRPDGEAEGERVSSRA